MDQIKQIRQYLEKSDFESALDRLAPVVAGDADRQSRLLLLSGRYHELAKKENMGVISYENASLAKNQIALALIQLVAELEDEQEEQSATVLISYNHQDADIARKLKNRLQQEGVTVTIDSANMQAGESITNFINRSIRDTGTTLSIVSVPSLLSAWVAMETLGTFGLQQGRLPKKFIPCYTDPVFFTPGFTDQALAQIGNKITTLTPLLAKRIENSQDTLDLQDEYSRLIKLRDNLGAIVGRLKGSLCMDISEAGFEASFPKILAAIKQRT